MSRIAKKIELTNIEQGMNVYIDYEDFICVNKHQDTITTILTFYQPNRDCVYTLTTWTGDAKQVDLLVDGTDVEMIGYDEGELFID